MTRQLPVRKLRGTWVQTERAAHEEWAQLIIRAPKAAAVMHILTARMGDNNAVVISQRELQDATGVSRPTVQRALNILRDENWIEIWQVGESGTVNAYVVNDRVAWHGSRDGIRRSLMSATLVLSEREQKGKEHLIGQDTPLKQVPTQLPGEQQLPSGDGLPPVSQPALPGMDADLPATRRLYDPVTGEVLE
ncbi:helix-turn-helix domain-containing protein [Paracoccus gahaiensis]|uniref:Helix-turn-helix domain-containing protein n=1 Tax=Paracoccus gahaiensis TaxID=1706839 RepID=A0A4U0R2M4_9RHOB|nr:GntR family transcriptional regulator [Paracoccus gahaiensis]TJZ89015.1 helix-turn-helix domain-containing protein [Paracoccus gahaiensis]